MEKTKSWPENGHKKAVVHVYYFPLSK